MRRVIFVLCCSLLGCAPEGPPPAGRLPVANPCEGVSAGWRCDDGDAVRCEQGTAAQRDRCAAQDAMCVEGKGCQACFASTYACDERDRLRCRDDGSGYELLETCEAGDQCTLLGCVDLCARAAKERSYIGCEYWPVTTANHPLDRAFEPAVVIANPQLQTAHVRLSRGEQSWDLDVPPGELGTLALPFVTPLKSPYARVGSGAAADVDSLSPRSMLVREGAYHLVSDMPVTVHQFNPLEFQVEGCEDPENEQRDRCFSQSNDASLLLPTTALTGDYMVVTRPTFSLSGLFEGQSPGFVAIVGTQSEPTEVQVRVTAHVAASLEGQDSPFAALAPGETLTVALGAGDVLQLASDAVGETCPGETRQEELIEGAEPQVYCDPGADYDLTGTEVHADAPVEVIAGHNCTFVPFDRWACDHLEESMFPIESWDDEVVVTRPVREGSEAYRIKVVSAVDGNRVRVDPPLSQKLVLDRGESFEWVSKKHVLVRGDGPLAVAQFLLGQGGGDESGDPSMSLAVPAAQFKRSYTILTPSSFEDAYVNIVAAAGTGVTLNGRLVGGFTPIGDSGLSVARQPLGAGGLYQVEGKGPIGVVQYGFAPYTSYMVPGGLDLTLLQPPPI